MLGVIPDKTAASVCKPTVLTDFSNGKQCHWSKSHAYSEALRETIPVQNGARLSCNRWIATNSVQIAFMGQRLTSWAWCIIRVDTFCDFKGPERITDTCFRAVRIKLRKWVGLHITAIAGVGDSLSPPYSSPLYLLSTLTGRRKSLQKPSETKNINFVLNPPPSPLKQTKFCTSSFIFSTSVHIFVSPGFCELLRLPLKKKKRKKRPH